MWVYGFHWFPTIFSSTSWRRKNRWDQGQDRIITSLPAFPLAVVLSPILGYKKTVVQATSVGVDLWNGELHGQCRIPVELPVELLMRRTLGLGSETEVIESLVEWMSHGATVGNCKHYAQLPRLFCLLFDIECAHLPNSMKFDVTRPLYNRDCLYRNLYLMPIYDVQNWV
jgi:hypothetical protein